MDPESLAAGIPWDFVTFPEYLGSVEQRGTVLNFAAYIGHTPLRIYVMGDEASSRTARPDEVAEMAASCGGHGGRRLGFATSFAITHLGADGQPIPSRWADRTELDALFRAVADSGRGVIGINGVNEELHFDQIYDLQRELGVPVTWTALLTSSTGAHNKALDLHRQGMSEGSEVWPQVSPRPLTFSMNMVEPFTLNTSPVFAELMAGTLRRAFGGLRRSGRGATVCGRPGPRVPRAASRRVGRPTRSWSRRPVPSWSAGASRSSPRPRASTRSTSCSTSPSPSPRCKDIRVKAVLANDDEAGVATLLQEDGCTLGLSDAGAHVTQLCDAPLATDLLARWVREKGVLTLEEAVHKLTQVQADLFGFEDRGVVREGFAADLVVFDPDTVAPGPLRRMHDFPAGAERLTADQPEGMRHLLVNGVHVIADGTLRDEAVATRPGRIVRPAAR